MRVAILWTGLSGYLNACMKELAGREGVELFVCHHAPDKNAPFDESQFTWIADRFMWRSNRDLEPLGQRLHSFAPDIMILAGWHVPMYRRLAREYANKCWRVMIMDNPWRGTLKQWIGILVAPYYLRPAVDVVWLPGERQSVFARKMSFKERAILRGSFSCDQPVFAKAHLARVTESRPVPRAFLFAGRFIPAKGVNTLVSAYQSYRNRAPDPWPLICCGAGPLQTRLEGQPGIRIEGFVQPEQMPAMLASAGCFILPSEFEPWALVIHEAASAGLLILASETVGAAIHLVQPNYNGFIFGNRDAQGLADLMSRVSSMNDARLDAMSQASHLLSHQFSPRHWADTLLESFCALT
jgi:glycosyltransferase involved in cell wall biosynthesis